MWVDRTAAERMAKQRQRRKEGGLVEVRLWVRPELVPVLKAIAAGAAPPSARSTASPEPVPDPIDPMEKVYREMSNFPRDGGADNVILVVVTFFEKPHKLIRDNLKNIGIRKNKYVVDDEKEVWEGFAKVNEIREIEGQIFRSKGVIRA